VTQKRPHIAYLNYTKSNRIPWLFLIFYLSVFYPLGIGMGGGLLWIELAAPAVFVLMIIENILKQRPMLVPKNRIYFVAILVFFIWACISWIKYPIYGSGSAISSGAEVGIKTYYRIIVSISAFFVSLWFSYFYLKKEFYIFLKILLFFSLFIGVVRLLGFFRGFNIPFMYGSFRYNLEASTALGEVTLRLSGLDFAGYCGTFSLLALKQTRYALKTIWFVLLLIVFTMFIFMNAGRTLAISYLLALFYYAVFIEGIDIRKVFSGVVLIILLVISLQFLPDEILRGQISRITDLSGGVQGQYEHRRGYVYDAFMEAFYDNPVFGRGIRPVSIGRADRNTMFIQQMLSDGGHGAYYSMLGLFGLGGAFFLAIFLFLTLVKCHLIITRNKGPDREIFVFIMLFLVLKILIFYTGGKGYNDYALYSFAGIFVGLQAKEYGIIKNT